MPCCNTAPYKRLQRLLSCQCSLYRPHRKAAHRALQALFQLFAVFFHCCAAVHPDIPHHLRHAGAYHSTAAPLPIPDTTATQDAVQASTACYYKRYIRVRPLLWLHARQSSISQTMPARRGQRLHLYEVSPEAVSMLPTPGGLQSGTGSAVKAHPPPGGAVQQQGCGGRRGTIGGYRRSSFRAFSR